MLPRIIAHRGASGVAFENSLEAFRRAAQLGADGIELDIHATSDGALLVHHDFAVPGVGVIGEQPHSAFARYRLPNGEPIPTLAEALASVPGLEVWVEVKTLPPGYDARLFSALDAGPSPDRYAVHAFDHRIVLRLGEARPTLSRGVLLASYLLETLPVLHGTGADTLWMDTHLIDRTLVDDLHAEGRRIIAWTVNDEREVQRLCRLEVDGICGNHPDRIRGALA